KARPGRRRHGIDLAKPDPGLVERAAHQPVHMVEMRPRRDLGHDPAIGRVLVELRQHDVGADFPPLADHRHRGLVARGFDPENGQWEHHGQMAWVKGGRKDWTAGVSPAPYEKERAGRPRPFTWSPPSRS